MTGYVNRDPKRVACPRCGAEPGKRCVSKNNKPSDSHAARFNKLYQFDPTTRPPFYQGRDI